MHTCTCVFVWVCMCSAIRDTLSLLLSTQLLHNATVPVAIRMEFSGCEASLHLIGSTLYSTCAHIRTYARHLSDVCSSFVEHCEVMIFR